jgi:hypothetical protein
MKLQIDFLGEFAKLRKVTVSFVMPVSLSLCCPFAWKKNLAPTGRIFMTVYNEYLSKIQVSFKSDKENRYLTWKLVHIYDNIKLYS